MFFLVVNLFYLLLQTAFADLEYSSIHISDIVFHERHLKSHGSINFFLGSDDDKIFSLLGDKSIPFLGCSTSNDFGRRTGVARKSYAVLSLTASAPLLVKYIENNSYICFLCSLNYSTVLELR